MLVTRVLCSIMSRRPHLPSHLPTNAMAAADRVMHELIETREEVNRECMEIMESEEWQVYDKELTHTVMAVHASFEHTELTAETVQLCHKLVQQTVEETRDRHAEVNTHIANLASLIASLRTVAQNTSQAHHILLSAAEPVAPPRCPTQPTAIHHGHEGGLVSAERSAEVFVDLVACAGNELEKVSLVKETLANSSEHVYGLAVTSGNTLREALAGEQPEVARYTSPHVRIFSREESAGPGRSERPKGRN